MRLLYCHPDTNRFVPFDQTWSRQELTEFLTSTIVWYGRWLGYAGRYEEAVAVFSRGLEVLPDSAWLLRFRGHRYITLRRFDEAVADLERADALAQGRPDQVEPRLVHPRSRHHGRLDRDDLHCARRGS